MDPYRKFVAFYTRSQDAFINFSLVLDAAMSLEVEEFGDLTKEQCVFLFSAVCGCTLFVY
jgi:hypothetical protein